MPNKKVATSRDASVPAVAVIGAGISGLFAARTLADRGLNVKVFDKGRGLGGRMSTRRVDGKSCFDHGAQYFTARDPRFQSYVQSWMEQGVVAKWPDPQLDPAQKDQKDPAQKDPAQKIVVFKNGERTEQEDSNERFVGTPAMNSVCHHLAAGLDVRTATRIETVEPIHHGKNVAGRSIRLTDNEGNHVGDFDCLIVTAPAAQTAELLVNFPVLAAPISKVQMQPCWAVMASFEKPVGDDWVGAFIHDSIVTWAARNSTKPQRPNEREHLLIHAGHDWTAENWERDPVVVAEEVLREFWKSAGLDVQTPVHLQAHRWKYAIPIDPPAERYFFDAESMIVACGDWAGGPRVEGAFLSGMAAAERILDALQSVEFDDTTAPD